MDTNGTNAPDEQLLDRIRDYIVEAHRFAPAKPTGTQREAYRIAGAELTQEIARLRKLVELDLKELDREMDAAGAPWTPGRLSDWKEK